MAAVFKLTNGTDEVDFNDSNNFQVRQLTPHILQLRAPRVPMPVTLKLNPQADHDAAASDIITMIKLLDEIEAYKDGITNAPVYIEYKADSETGTRYSVIEEVRDLEHPDLLEYIFKQHSAIIDFPFTLIRETKWRSDVPGALPTVTTLTASDGPADPDMAHVANFRDDGALSHVKVDNGGSFTDVLDANDGTALFPASPAADDALYFLATDIAFKHMCLEIATAMDSFSGTLVAEYYNGSSYASLALGDDFTVFAENGGEVTTLDDLFTQTGLWSINLYPPSDWAKDTVDGVNGYPFRIRISAFTSIGTVPTKNGDDIYAQRSPYIEIPAAAIKGDSPLTALVRAWAPSGGDNTPGPGNVSSVMIAARSEPSSSFSPFLNAGGQDNPSGWSVAQNTDATATADNEAPGGFHSAVDFSTEAGSEVRVTFTGTGQLDDYEGEFRVLLRVQQVGATVGACKASARIKIGGSADDDPQYDTVTDTCRGVDEGPELLDLGVVSIPGPRAFSADTLTGSDLILEILAQRESGSPTLRIYDLILWPVDEGSFAAEDTALDISNGSGALRGGSVLDVDEGVIADRTIKYRHDGTNLAPAVPWGPKLRLPEFRKIGTEYRLYFLMLHYPVGGAWGTGPYIATLGMHMAVQFYQHARYTILRGAD